MVSFSSFIIAICLFVWHICIYKMFWGLSPYLRFRAVSRTGYYLYFREEETESRAGQVTCWLHSGNDKNWIQIFWLCISQEYFGNKWQRLRPTSAQKETYWFIVGPQRTLPCGLPAVVQSLSSVTPGWDVWLALADGSLASMMLTGWRSGWKIGTCLLGMLPLGTQLARPPKPRPRGETKAGSEVLWPKLRPQEPAWVRVLHVPASRWWKPQL